jgi:hypothetical protein
VRALALLLFIAAPAHADLYRWIDPDSGSVKLSTMPPSDPRANAELVPFRNAAATTQAPAAVKSGPAGPLAALEARLSEIVARIAATAPQQDSRSADGYRQQLEAYEAVRAELDRIDPSGAARRRSESTSLLDRLRQGFAAQK